MKNMHGPKVLLAVLSVLLAFTFTVSGQTGGKRRGNCSAVSDASIARSINNYIAKLKAQNPRANIRIDVGVKNKSVSLRVRRASKRVHQDVARYARTIRCVKGVQSGSLCYSASCPNKMYLCGDSCIPCSMTCSP